MGLLDQGDDVGVGEPEAAGLGERGGEDAGGEVGAAPAQEGVAGQPFRAVAGRIAQWLESKGLASNGPGSAAG